MTTLKRIAINLVWTAMCMVPVVAFIHYLVTTP